MSAGPKPDRWTSFTVVTKVDPAPDPAEPAEPTFDPEAPAILILPPLVWIDVREDDVITEKIVVNDEG